MTKGVHIFQAIKRAIIYDIREVNGQEESLSVGTFVHEYTHFLFIWRVTKWHYRIMIFPNGLKK